MRIMDPQLIVSYGVGIGGLEPCAVIMSFRLLCFVNGHDHGGEEGRLRAGQQISAICIEYSAVVANLKEKVLDNVARRICTVGLHQATDNEIAVPPIHLVEHAAWDHIRMRKIEQGV